MAIPHFVAQAYGFVDEAEKLGARVILYDAGEHKNVAKQVSQMEDLIANKVDAICIVPGTTATAVAQIDQAIAAGIPVVNVNIMSDNPKVLGRVRSDDYELGRLATVPSSLGFGDAYGTLAHDGHDSHDDQEKQRG